MSAHPTAGEADPGPGDPRAALARAEAQIARLREDRDRLALALDGAGDASWDWDVGSTRMRFSDAWFRLLGYEPGELVQDRSTWLRRVHPDDLARLSSALEEHLRGATPAYTAEYRIRVRGGGWRWFLARGRVVERGPDGAPLRMVGTLTDVDERHSAEDALAAERDRMAAMIAQMQDGVVVLDASGRVALVNDRFLEIFGLAREEAMGAGPPYPWWPAHDPDVTRDITDVLRGGGRGEWERVLARADGSPVPVVIAAAALPGGGAVGTVKDVSSRMRAERERDAVARITRAVAEGGDIAAVLDLAAGQVRDLLGCESCVVVRIADDGWADLVGRSGRARDLGIARVLVTESPVRLVRADPSPQVAPPAPVTALLDDGSRLSVPYGEIIVAGIVVEGHVWGALAVLGGEDWDRPELIGRIAELLSLAISRAEARDELARQATTDPLTGLANTRAFHERLGQEVARSRRYGAPLALCLVDLDHFKRVNDTHGHAQGDEVLRDAARCLAGEARAADVVARVGGEEFAWLMPGAAPGDAVAAAERLRAAIEAAGAPPVGVVTASAGVAALARDEDVMDLYRRADAALYRAKRAGRDQVALAG